MGKHGYKRAWCWPVYWTFAQVGNDDEWDRAIAFRSPLYWARDWSVELPPIIVDMSALVPLESRPSKLWEFVSTLGNSDD